MPFTNPIVAGTTLVREAIHSPDYVAGVSGWSINRDGSAEFNDGVFRGDLQVGGPNPPNPSVHISELTIDGLPGYYGLAVHTDFSTTPNSTVIVAAGPSTALIVLDPPSSYVSNAGQIKGEERGSGHASTTVISPNEAAAPGAFATLWLEGNTVAEPADFQTELYTSEFNITSNRMNLNGRGILRDGDSTSERQLAFKSGTTVVSTNASGIATINPGFTTLVGFVPWVGDGTSASYTLGNQRSGWPVSGNSVDVHVRLSTTGANVASTLVRIDWIAIGVL